MLSDRRAAHIEATYQHTSLAITSNSHPSRFADLMPQVRPTQINAAIDRLMHHAIVIQTEGESQRYIDATTRR